MRVTSLAPLGCQCVRSSSVIASAVGFSGAPGKTEKPVARIKGVDARVISVGRQPEPKQMALALGLVEIFVRRSGMQDRRVVQKLDVAGLEVHVEMVMR